ncbi:hypothetical protein FGIG_05110 [Fasciola gigantica]|uniref:Uncharacterized protein n=1 Tax=Fasciola gigantica TaxID=46835 RepID=A0A504YBN8_FASGI|nr:hypothetical protein FGIG_05110 [Fasciola gigantica]
MRSCDSHALIYLIAFGPFGIAAFANNPHLSLIYFKQSTADLMRIRGKIDIYCQ